MTFNNTDQQAEADKKAREHQAKMEAEKKAATDKPASM
jgi:hypothetical protein